MWLKYPWIYFLLIVFLIPFWSDLTFFRSFLWLNRNQTWPNLRSIYRDRDVFRLCHFHLTLTFTIVSLNVTSEHTEIRHRITLNFIGFTGKDEWTKWCLILVQNFWSRIYANFQPSQCSIVVTLPSPFTWENNLAFSAASNSSD